MNEMNHLKKSLLIDLLTKFYEENHKDLETKSIASIVKTLDIVASSNETDLSIDIDFEGENVELTPVIEVSFDISNDSL